MQQIICNCNNDRLKTDSFYAQADLLTGVILKQIKTFQTAVEKINDRARQAKSNILPS